MLNQQRNELRDPTLRGKNVFRLILAQLLLLFLLLSVNNSIFACCFCQSARGDQGIARWSLQNVRIPATNLLPQGRRVSELPPEEQKIINDAIMRDVEHRKAKNLDRADILTEHTRACPEPSRRNADGKVTITHRVIKDK